MTDTAGAPTYTKIPNAILEAMPAMSEAELRVVLAIARKTIGWQKESDVVSITQLEAVTGLSRQGVIDGVNAALKRGVISRTLAGKNNGYCYQVVNSVDYSEQSSELTSQDSRLLVVKPVDHLEPQVVKLVDTQKKEYKEKKERDRAPKKEPKERPERQANLNGFSESVAIYRQLTGKKTVAPALATMIADTVIDIPHWTAVVTAWCGAGFRPDNVSGMLDWYLHPDKMGKHASRHEPPAPRPTPQPTRPPMPDGVLPPEVVAAKMHARLNELRNGAKDD